MSGLELARWALYVDLGVLFGLPTAIILLRSEASPDFARRPLLVLAIIAFPLAIAGFLILVAEMAGVEISGLEPDLIFELLTGSALGWATLARLIALAAVLVLLVRRQANLRWLSLATAIALGSLAWSGHAASSEGWRSAMRLSLDIAHLLAASIWIGALALFLAMLFRGARTASQTVAALTRFAGIGSMMVGILLATGIANLLFIASPDQWPGMLSFPYGRLFLLKLCAFLGMLALAGVNRFVLVPKLQGQDGVAANATALRNLKLSIVLETGLGLGVLLLVATLGLLDPSGS